MTKQMSMEEVSMGEQISVEDVDIGEHEGVEHEHTGKEMREVRGEYGSW